MPELRCNPVTAQWVIIAGERGKRPHARAQSRRRRRAPSYLEGCPFCPGNEAQTPPAVLEVPEPDGHGRWQVRAFPNKFAALTPTPAPVTGPEGPLFVAVPGEGAHEVIVETPLHNRFPADWDEEEMARVVEAYQQRCIELLARPSTEYVLVFKNHGEAAGTSLEHPHSQIVAAPVVPQDVRLRAEIAEEHFRSTGRCLLCRLAEDELRAGTRIVHRDDRFVVFHPFAAARPAETWIVPLEHQPAFERAPEQTASAFGSVLGRALRGLRAAFGDPDFNYAIHSAPKAEADRPFHHWYLQLMPRLTRAAGFELGSGIYINVSPPEETAERMRRALE